MMVLVDHTLMFVKGDTAVTTIYTVIFGMEIAAGMNMKEIASALTCMEAEAPALLMLVEEEALLTLVAEVEEALLALVAEEEEDPLAWLASAEEEEDPLA